MKKSYDYFKTLKVLSEIVSEIFKRIISAEDYSANRITFFAEKSELINNLQKEFITPLERGDIFLLEESLSEELNSIFILCEYLNLITQNEINELKSLEATLKRQNHIFSRIDNFKGNIKLFEECSEEIKHLNLCKKNIEKNIIDAIKCKTEQPLIKYAFYSALLTFNRCVYNTIFVIERILMDNS